MTPITPMSQLFKAIALFTPGGDLIYCIDPSKQGRWHVHLCVALQEILNLPEPPHFLIPGYTATIDRWLDPNTGSVRTVAEVYPAVQRYQPLLNAAFGTGELVWKTSPWEDSSCNPILLDTYRDRFGALWEDHNLILQVSLPGSRIESKWEISPCAGYVLRLFVSGNSRMTEQTLVRVHQLLEKGLGNSYTLKVIDILSSPEEAEINQVSATPTLVRVSPLPVRRIVGELADPSRALQILTTY
ncbi:MAG: circadian clock protein KaiB [Prochloron sp. SP5CPC1]|nr:circadian clock protein KaiB [Candidatus Paraprochloron terpiosi SP5CPC1]